MGQTPGVGTLPGPAGGGGDPSQGGTLAGGTLAGGGGVPWSGTPPPPPARSGWGGGPQVGQQKEYSIHGERYASYVHAGGLSCLFVFFAE